MSWFGAAARAIGQTGTDIAAGQAANQQQQEAKKRLEMAGTELQLEQARQKLEQSRFDQEQQMWPYQLSQLKSAQAQQDWLNRWRTDLPGVFKETFGHDFDWNNPFDRDIAVSMITGSWPPASSARGQGLFTPQQQYEDDARVIGAKRQLESLGAALTKLNEEKPRAWDNIFGRPQEKIDADKKAINDQIAAQQKILKDTWDEINRGGGAGAGSAGGAGGGAPAIPPPNKPAPNEGPGTQQSDQNGQPIAPPDTGTDTGGGTPHFIFPTPGPFPSPSGAAANQPQPAPQGTVSEDQATAAPDYDPLARWKAADPTSYNRLGGIARWIGNKAGQEWGEMTGQQPATTFGGRPLGPPGSQPPVYGPPGPGPLARANLWAQGLWKPPSAGPPPGDLSGHYFSESGLQKQSFAENPKQDPKAENPQSSASGLYQIIDSTWREFQQTANQMYHPQPPWNYSRAKDAPPEVQHRVAMLIPVSRWAMEGAASGGVIARNSSNWR